MKVAICFSGLPRFIHEGYKLFSKNLTGFRDMDIFCHSWIDGVEGNHNHLTRQDTIEEVESLYNITDSVYETQKYKIAPDNITHEEFIHWSMFYSMWSANNIKKQYENKNNIKYDFVIRARFDCAVLSSIDVTEYNNNTVLVPWVHRGTTLMDWFNFSSSEIMDIHANVWKCMSVYKNGGVQMTSGEELLTAHLNANSIKFTAINKDVKLIRTNVKSRQTWIHSDKL